MNESYESILTATDVLKKYPTGFQSGPSTFSIQAGEAVAFLGPNGAGKSTLFQMISGNMDPDSGQIFFQDQKLHPEAYEIKKQIGYLPQNMMLPKWSTGKEVLNYAAGLYQISNPVSKLKELMEYWDCGSYQHKPLESCSHGMQKRIGLALSCLHNPRLLILDEPFSGLDLFHIRALIDEIRRRKENGLGTILSTHIAPYVARLCSSVLVIESGSMSSLEGWSELSESDKVSGIESRFQ